MEDNDKFIRHTASIPLFSLKQLDSKTNITINLGKILTFLGFCIIGLIGLNLIIACSDEYNWKKHIPKLIHLLYFKWHNRLAIINGICAASFFSIFSIGTYKFFERTIPIFVRKCVFVLGVSVIALFIFIPLASDVNAL